MLDEILDEIPHPLRRNFIAFLKKLLAERSQILVGYSIDSGLSNRTEGKI